MTKKFDILQKRIGYDFKDENYLKLSLSHSSYVNEVKKKAISSNERLEFLGDSVLNLIISEKLFLEFPEFSEGQLSKLRSFIVCEPSLAMCSKKIGLGEFLMLGKGEDLTGGRDRNSILADLFEALVGAIYLDGGYKFVKTFIEAQTKEIYLDVVNGFINLDYKTALQELVQRESELNIEYEIISESGPDHYKVFVSQVKINGDVRGQGNGKTKKEAEQNAAREAFQEKRMMKLDSKNKKADLQD